MTRRQYEVHAKIPGEGDRIFQHTRKASAYAMYQRLAKAGCPVALILHEKTGREAPREFLLAYWPSGPYQERNVTSEVRMGGEGK